MTILLHDSDGNGIGEAVMKFCSEKLAARAQRIHGQDFLGTNVQLTHKHDTNGRHIGKSLTDWHSSF